VIALGIIAAICAVMTFLLCVFTAFIWLAERYTPLTAALVLTLFFLLVAILAGVGMLLAHRSTIQHAKTELAARQQSALLDPGMAMMAMQLARSIGLRRIVPLVAAGLLAAGFAREWLRSDPQAEHEAAEPAE
jgi:hypothetical protein